MSLIPKTSIKRAELLDSMLRRADLVIVTGAGVSLQSVGYPNQPGTEIAGWKGLLENGVVYCEQYGLVGSKGAAIARLQIQNPETPDDLIDAAQKIHDWLAKRTNARIHWVKESIGMLRVFDPSLISAIQNLGGLITTLNYDDLICEVTKRVPVHWKEQEIIDGYIRTGSKDYILHIHGHWKDPDSMVLDRASYNEISASSKMQQLMQRFARWHTMLFIGCGDTLLDPNFYTLLKWCNTALKGASHRHFILCRACDEAGFIESLKPYGFLEPLTYGESYADLVPFLNLLANDSGAKAVATNPPVSEVVSSSLSVSSNLQTASDIWKLQTQL